MADIIQYNARSGRLIKENNTIVNEADGINADGSQNVRVTTDSITPTHLKVTVTTTSQQALAANANRKYVIFANHSDTVIFIKFGAMAVVDEGIPIYPSCSYEMSAILGNLYTGVVNAITTVDNKILLIMEGE